jgi:hypothetical protein
MHLQVLGLTSLAGWHRLAFGLTVARMDTNRFRSLSDRRPESVRVSGSDVYVSVTLRDTMTASASVMSCTQMRR